MTSKSKLVQYSNHNKYVPAFLKLATFHSYFAKLGANQHAVPRKLTFFLCDLIRHIASVVFKPLKMDSYKFLFDCLLIYKM